MTGNEIGNLVWDVGTMIAALMFLWWMFFHKD